MATGRGLNKGRGLGSLIPPKNTADIGTDIAETKKPTREVKSATRTKQVSTSAKKESNNAEVATTNAVFDVRLTQIVPNRKQPRKHFDEDAIAELAASIREHGIVTPLLVHKKGKYYELIAGERRWRAAKAAGLKKVPVLLREFSEQEAAEIALIENIQREDLNAMEEARAYRQLIDDFSLKQEEIAKRVSKSRSAVANALRLLKLDTQVQDMLADGKISMGHARALLSLEDPELQRLTAGRVEQNDLSVRETERLVKRLLTPKKALKAKPADLQIEAVYRDLEEQLMRTVGTRVSILPIKGKKGKVEIEYYSNEDLERIIDRLRRE